MDEILNIDKICRSCLIENINRRSIFESSNENNEQILFSDMLLACASVKINSCDGLPDSLCEKCIQELNIAYNFKNRCEKNDKYLRFYLASLATKPVDAKENETNFENISETEQKLNENYKTDMETEIEPDKSDKKEKSKTCKICLRSFKNIMILKRHMKSHGNFSHHIKSRSKLYKRLKEYSVGNIKNKNKSKEDGDKQEESSKHICKLCNKTFTQSSSLVVHMKRHKGEKAHKCHLCPKAFTTSGSLTIHVRSHTGERPYECKECNKCFVTSDSLHKHQRRHSGERPHLCSVCGKGFGAAGTLQVHMRLHSGDKPLKCNICNMGFAAHAGLSVHLRKHTGERPYLCQHCGKGFKSSSDLTAHTRKHTGERPYPCDMCDKHFRTSYMRSVHRRTHTGERPAQCSVCQKTFTSNGHLSIHLRSHWEVKPHSCMICNRSFTMAKDLTLHMMVHTGQRPHVCPQCGKGFNRPNNLAKHIRLHSGVKPHVCEICKYAFSTSTQLKVHIRSHTGERPYSCQDCDKSFASSSGLARHKRRQHLNDNKSQTKQKSQKQVIHSNDQILQNESIENMVLHADSVGNTFDSSMKPESNLSTEAMHVIDTTTRLFDSSEKLPTGTVNVIDIKIPTGNINQLIDSTSRLFDSSTDKLPTGTHVIDTVNLFESSRKAKTVLPTATVSHVIDSVGLGLFDNSKKTEIALQLTENALRETINMEQYNITENTIVSSHNEINNEKLNYETMHNVQSDVLKFDNLVPISDTQILGVTPLTHMYVPLNRQHMDDIFK